MWEAPFVRWRHHGNARGHGGQAQGQEDESQNDERQKPWLTCFAFFFSQKSIQNDSTHPQHDMMIHRMIYNLYQLMITEDHYIAHIF